MPSPRVTLVGPKNFAAHQGHDLLAHYLVKGGAAIGQRGYHGQSWQNVIGKMVRRIRKMNNVSPAGAYEIFCVDLLTRLSAIRGGLTHAIWGDEALEWVRSPERAIYTVHQPHEIWTERQWNHIRRARAVITMAQRESDVIKTRSPHTATTFIPLGIDINFWNPAPEKARTAPKIICAAGRYMRNYEMLMRIANRLIAKRDDVAFRWLVNPDFKITPEIAAALPASRFEVVRNLSDVELRNFYWESWLFFTPYNNVTASNSIVEALACGTPMFSTRVAGMESYAGDGAITLLENNDDEAALLAIERCLDSESVRQQHAARARHHAETQLAWPAVVQAHAAFYATLT